MTAVSKTAAVLVCLLGSSLQVAAQPAGGASASTGINGGPTWQPADTSTTVQPPTGLVASSIAGNVVTLRWQAPTSGPAPTSYTLEGGLSPGQVLGGVSTGDTNPVFTFTAPSGAFYIRVHANAGLNRSVASNEIRVFVNTSALPSAPANLLGLVNGSSVTLAWTNTFAGGAPTSIVLDVSGSLSVSAPLGLTDTFSAAGVPAGTYTLSLRASNASGFSPSSQAITLTFPGACSGAPLPPANFLAYRVGEMAFVTWDPAATGPAPTSFQLNVTGAFVGSVPTTGRLLSGAVPPGVYNLSVQAMNPCGSSAATAEQTVVIPPAALHCVAFSPYVSGYSPLTGPHPPPAVIDALLDNLVATTDFRCIQTYGVLHGQDYVFEAAQARGLKVIAILWLDGQSTDQASIDLGIESAIGFPATLIRIACGSEVRLRHGATMAEAIVGNCVSQLKAGGVTQPVGTNDTWWEMCNGQRPCQPWSFASQLDWLGANVFAWWENKFSGLFTCIPAANVAAFTVARLQDVVAAYPSKEVVLTEFGWPAGPDGYTEVNQFTAEHCGVASQANQDLVIGATVDELRRLSLPHVVFEMYREGWKTAEGPVGVWWGLQ